MPALYRAPNSRIRAVVRQPVAFAEKGTQCRGGSWASGRSFLLKATVSSLGVLTTLSSFPFLSLFLETVVLLCKVNCLPIIVSRSLSVSSLCLRTRGVRGRISTNATHTPTPLLLSCLQKRLVFPWHWPLQGSDRGKCAWNGCSASTPAGIACVLP